MSWIFGAFTFAYAVFEVPTGWLGDVFGPRRTLIRIVLWWSFFTALTGVIWPVAGLVPIMFSALGAGQVVGGADSHAGVPWRRLFGSSNLWLLCGMYFLASYGWYLNITYLPGYL